MSHLIAPQRLARLKANKLAYAHFEAHREIYLRYSQQALATARTASAFAHWENQEVRVNIVKTLIMDLDGTIWSLQTPWMPGEEIAESFARLVVGHE